MGNVSVFSHTAGQHDATHVTHLKRCCTPFNYSRCRPIAATVLQHDALAGIPVVVLANKSDVRGAADSATILDRVVRGTSLLAPSGATSAGGSPPSAAPTPLSPSDPSAGGLDGAAATASISGGPPHVHPHARRECRVFRSSALTGEGIKVGTDWLINAAKQHMYDREGSA